MKPDPKSSHFVDEALETALAALAEGMATVDELRRAAYARRQARPVIGKLALTERKLRMPEVFRILGQQAITGEMFGDLAVRMGLLDEAGLNDLLRLQATLTPALSDVLVTQGILTSAQAEALRNNVRQRLRSPPELTVTGTAH